MRRSGLLVAAAMAAMAGASLPGTPGQPGGPEAREGQQAQRGGEKNRNTAGATAARMALQRALSGSLVRGRVHYRNRAGWTNRRYQRAAAKKRNQARHRAAAKGHKR